MFNSVPLTETNSVAHPICNKFEPGARSVRCFSTVWCKPHWKAESADFCNFTIPFCKLLSETKVQISSGTIVLGLSGILGWFEFFGGIYSRLSFLLLHWSFQPRVNIYIQRETAMLKMTKNSLKIPWSLTKTMQKTRCLTNKMRYDVFN